MYVYPFYSLPGKTLYPRVLSIRLYPDITAHFTGYFYPKGDDGRWVMIRLCTMEMGGIADGFPNVVSAVGLEKAFAHKGSLA
eukprot:scaffold28759_cov70-Cyclotella_meneghiniana.AAC.1